MGTLIISIPLNNGVMALMNDAGIYFKSFLFYLIYFWHRSGKRQGLFSPSFPVCQGAERQKKLKYL
jgi:hypothetical protein